MRGVDFDTALVVEILEVRRPERHPNHFSIRECIEMLGKIGAKRSSITHITHKSEHHDLQSRLGEGINVPWDGMEIEL